MAINFLINRIGVMVSDYIGLKVCTDTVYVYGSSETNRRLQTVVEVALAL